MQETEWLWWLSVAEKRLQPDTILAAFKGAVEYIVAVKNVPINMRRTNAHIKYEKLKVKKLERLVENPWGGVGAEQPGGQLDVVR